MKQQTKHDLQTKCLIMFYTHCYRTKQEQKKVLLMTDINHRKQPVPGSEMVVESRSVKRKAKNARGLGRDRAAAVSPIFPAATAPFPMSCASYFRFARFNTFPLYYLRAWHRLHRKRLIRPLKHKSKLCHKFDSKQISICK